jgi:uncharacterized protein YndB with AHSA1/START domain
MAESGKPSLTLARRLNAPVERVYKAWIEGAALKRWFGLNDDIDVVVADVDARIGGRYRIVMQKPGGEQHRVGGVYREIVPNAKLVFTWAWESTPERESLVTVQMQAVDGGTHLTLTHEQFADEAARDRHRQGWTSLFERLSRYFGAL